MVEGEYGGEYKGDITNVASVGSQKSSFNYHRMKLFFRRFKVLPPATVV